MSMLLNEEQRMLEESASDFFSSRVEIGALRALRDDGPETGFDPSLWAEIVELGWTAIPWPEAYGGLDFGYKGLGVVSRAAGRRLAVSPLFASVWFGGTLVNLAGNELQKQEWLPAVAAGELRLAVALEERAHHAPHHVTTTATRQGSRFLLNGRKTFVLDGASADQLIVVARTAGEFDEAHGISLFVIDRDTPGVTVTPVLLADSQRAANIRFENAEVHEDAILAELGEGAPALDAALDIARIGLAAEMLGSLEECFERTVAYLKEREQFGAPIGSFQGLRHRAAQLYCEMELSRSVVLEALTALDEHRDGAEIARLASLAKCQVGEAFNRIAREGVQMHGGIGMTDEFDIGFFLKRSGVAEATLGNHDYHRDRFGALEGC